MIFAVYLTKPYSAERRLWAGNNPINVTGTLYAGHDYGDQCP